MKTPRFMLGFDDELLVDEFACGAGMSEGIEQDVGRHVDIAVNHDGDASADLSAKPLDYSKNAHLVVDCVSQCMFQRVGLMVILKSIQQLCRCSGLSIRSFAKRHKGGFHLHGFKCDARKAFFHIASIAAKNLQLRSLYFGACRKNLGVRQGEAT